MFSSNKSELKSISKELVKQKEKCHTLLQLGENGLLKLFRKGVDNLGAKYIKQLEKILNEEQTQLIVISIGSASSDIQQMPAYVLTQSSRTAIINIDPNIEDKESKNIKENLTLYSSPTSIDNNKYPKTYAALNELIKNSISANRYIIFTFFTSPFNLLDFKDIIDTNKNALGKNFTIISAYHEYQAVLVYNKVVAQLLTRDSFKAITPAMKAIFSGTQRTPTEVDEILKKYPTLSDYGKIYYHLSTLTIEDVVKADLSSIPKNKL
jgi:hypothetical protein